MNFFNIFMIVSIVIFIIGVLADAISRRNEEKNKIKLPKHTEDLRK